MDEFDYVVVGAGSAGCVIAARLSESGRYTVAVLEAGGADSSFWIHAPLGYGKLYDSHRYNWFFRSEPEPALNDAEFHQPRGKVLGGTSSINGMVYMRGQREDYELWRSLGNVGWAYDDVLPFFKKAEDNDRGGSTYRGTGGPLGVSSLGRHELAEAFLAAGQQTGYALNDDFNGPGQEGFGYNQVTTRNGRRSSAAVAYLHPAASRTNLRIITNAQARRVTMADGRVTGVEYVRDGKVSVASARREVIVSCGAFNSPQLLQLSGLGPGSLLQGHGIETQRHLPGVGENLQNHFTIDTKYRCSKPITLNDAVNNPIRKMAVGLQYLLFRSGLMATNANYCGACIKTDPALPSPDVQLRLRLWGRALRGRSDPKNGIGLSPFSAFEIAANLLHPESRGSVRIKDADYESRPEIRFNYFTTAGDRKTSLEALKTIRKLTGTPALAPYISEHLTPVPDSDEALLDFCRQFGRSNHHESGTCKMGIDSDAVVDPRLRVHGIGGLRVADASIMPRIVGGDPNAVVIMIGEKAAAMIAEDAGK